MLDAEMAWRGREISTFRLASKKDSVERDTMIRAGIAMIYAHWEGFIKAASEAYLEYVNNQGHLYRDLQTCFVVFGMKGKLSLLGDSRKAQTNIDVLDFVLTELDQPAKMALSSAIHTGSNLTSTVFSNIATSIGVSTVKYQTRFPLIDESLVSRRNSIAHGEYLALDPSGFIKLADEVYMMMRWYKTDIENAASLKSYRRATNA
ncbi:MAG: MAE_28990/MAE_18760 family HEPN-like nuclease [Devosia sp.]